METDPYLSTRQAAELLGVSPESVIRWILHCNLPAMRLPSGQYRVRRSDALARLKTVGGERVCRPGRIPRHVREGLRKYGLARFLPGEE